MVLPWHWQSRGKKGFRKEPGIAKYFTVTLRPWKLSKVGHEGTQYLCRLVYGETCGMLNVILGHRGCTVLRYTSNIKQKLVQAMAKVSTMKLFLVQI